MNALVKTQTIALNGLTALPVSIEVNTYNGDTSIMVGLPDNAVLSRMEKSSQIPVPS